MNHDDKMPEALGWCAVDFAVTAALVYLIARYFGFFS